MRFLITILSVFCYSSHCYKILIYAPKLFHSHLNFLGHIADTLVTAGHDVVFYMPTCDRSIRSNGTKLARTIERQSEMAVPRERSELLGNIWARGLAEVRETVYLVRRLTAIEDGICESQLADNGLLNRLRSEKFDIAINEASTLCGYALFRKIGVKKQICAIPTSLIEKLIEPFAFDINPSHVPAVLARSTDLMGFWERVNNMIRFIIATTFAETISMRLAVQRLKKYFDPSVDRAYALGLAARSTFVLANTNEFIEFPRAINRKLVYVSGIAVDKPQPLNEEFRGLMDSAKDGVVLVSMGSIAKSSRMPMSIKRAFVNSFRAFPNVTFIWKYEEEDDLGCDSQNIIKKKWVPQNDLLAHGNMRAFLSHAGVNGMLESVQAGVPIICIPLFFDQVQSAKKLEKQRAAIIIEKGNVTASSISWALRSVLYDKSFTFASRRLASIVNRSSGTAKQRVVRHVELAALRGEADRLDPVGRTLPLVYFYYIDCSSLVILIMLILLV